MAPRSNGNARQHTGTVHTPANSTSIHEPDHTSNLTSAFKMAFAQWAAGQIDADRREAAKERDQGPS